MFSTQKGYECPTCHTILVPSRLLYPIEKKNYDDDSYIKSQWNALEFYLKEAYMLSIFGYSAPNTDISAKEKIFKSWRGQLNGKDQIDRVEIIDKRGCDKNILKSTWEDFIYSHHVRVFDDIFDSFALKHPRRSGEAYLGAILNGEFIPDNPPPQTKSLEDLWYWYGDRVSAES